MTIPYFKYHPDPIGSGVIENSDKKCVCCGVERGCIYTGPVFSIEDLHESICPWCIENGNAAEKYDASFADSYPLSRKGIKQEIIDEVCLRTPGYFTWQQDSWLSHCDDACQFLGDASVNDVTSCSSETKSLLMREYNFGEEDWQAITQGYVPRGDPAIYKFRCFHCGQILFGWDCS